MTSNIPQNESVMSIDYLSSRRSDPSLRDNGYSDMSRSQPQYKADPERHLKKASSYMRLSMTSEGNAEVITKDGSSPSPPRASSAAQMTIQSSSEARNLHHAENNEAGSTAPKSVQRSSGGRSRDSRAWEFWCDKDARSELEDKAEKDASGSATGAIGLLRSKSGRRILASIPSKRNHVLSRQPSSLKRSKLGPVPQQLHRSSTSFGRLQNKSASSVNTAAKPVLKPKHSESEVPVYFSTNDSDKENWSPERDTSADDRIGNDHLSLNDHLHSDTRRSRTQHAVRRARPSGANDLTRGTSTSFSSSENNDPEADPELAPFMHAGQKSSSIAEEQDMDCVQGLLSLSQGNWR